MIGSKSLAPTELDGFDMARLTTELKKAKEELFNLRFQAAVGKLSTNTRLRAVRRDIARIYTVIRERELGIREYVPRSPAGSSAQTRVSEIKESQSTLPNQPSEAAAEVADSTETKTVTKGLGRAKKADEEKVK